MTGTEKQIKWAEDIKANMGWKDFKTQMPAGNVAAERVAAWIDNMDAGIWIENRDLQTADTLLRSLIMTGISCKSATYQADIATGNVTMSWTEADGRKEVILNK